MTLRFTWSARLVEIGFVALFSIWDRERSDGKLLLAIHPQPGATGDDDRQRTARREQVADGA